MPDLVLFQTERDALYPFSLSRATYSIYYGYRTILSMIRHGLGSPFAAILPKRLVSYYRERERNLVINPDKLTGDTLLINSAIRPLPGVLQRLNELKNGQFIACNGNIAAARLSSLSENSDFTVLTPNTLKSYGLEMLQANDMMIQGPWELIGQLRSGLEGKGVIYGTSVQTEEYVHFDTSTGPILIADNVRIEAFSRIQGPAIIGKNTVLHSARVNGYTLIGENCRIGGEVEFSIISSYSNKAHFGYIGHSYVGEWVNMGAGSVTSDLKNSYGNVRVTMQGKSLDTGMVKLGSFISDYAKISINAMLYAGKKVGTASHVHGLLDGDAPAFVIYGKSLGMGVAELAIERAVEIARRMKSRRNLELSKGEEDMLRACFEETKGERI
ncbi:MAG: putative sugar nucleotidyl transferase [Conexivisphaerales archaeon]